MARILTGMVLGLGVFFLFSGTTGRQANAIPQDAKGGEFKPTRIALVDMGKVFKNSRAYEKKRDSLKVEFAEMDEMGKSLQAAGLEMKKELDKLDKGAEERSSLEARLKKKAAEFEAFRVSSRQKVLKAEAEIFLEISNDVSAVIANYARDRGIDLVIRTNSEPIEKDDPQKIFAAGMNRMVLFENGLDITEDIIAAMK